MAILSSLYYILDIHLSICVKDVSDAERAMAPPPRGRLDLGFRV